MVFTQGLVKYPQVEQGGGKQFKLLQLSILRNCVPYVISCHML